MLPPASNMHVMRSLRAKRGMDGIARHPQREADLPWGRTTEKKKEGRAHNLFTRRRLEKDTKFEAAGQKGDRGELLLNKEGKKKWPLGWGDESIVVVAERDLK